MWPDRLVRAALPLAISLLGVTAALATAPDRGVPEIPNEADPILAPPAPLDAVAVEVPFVALTPVENPEDPFRVAVATTGTGGGLTAHESAKLALARAAVDAAVAAGTREVAPTFELRPDPRHPRTRPAPSDAPPGALGAPAGRPPEEPGTSGDGSHLRGPTSPTETELDRLDAVRGTSGEEVSR